MSVKTKLAQALYRERKSRGLTQAQAAEIFDISVRWYQKLESGRSEPNLKLACKMSKFFNIDFAKLTAAEPPEYVPL